MDWGQEEADIGNRLNAGIGQQLECKLRHNILLDLSRYAGENSEARGAVAFF